MPNKKSIDKIANKNSYITAVKTPTLFRVNIELRKPSLKKTNDEVIFRTEIW